MKGDKINNFKELEKEQEKAYEENTNRIKSSIDGNLDAISHFTNIIDMYFSKILNYMFSIDDKKENKSDQNSDNKVS